ncbi:MAG: hypothetical protein MJZ60_07780 [Bacteroidaceae bacterium]|nr:hypothetical protein [Bacteroidaceae bacterium]
MKNILALSLCTMLLSLCISSCSSDDDVYPSIISEMADLYTDAQGTTTKIVLDNDKTYNIENPQKGYAKNALYRVLCGFVPNGVNVTLYQLTGVNILRDSSSIARRDPVDLLSIWRTPRYINVHLKAKTQGGRQYWGFITDSIVTKAGADGTEVTHAYVSLHHNQNGDPTSYSDEVFVSLPLDSLKGIKQQSPITFSIKQTNGTKDYEL